MSEPIYIYHIPVVPQDYFWGWQMLNTMDENIDVACFIHPCPASKTAMQAFVFLKNTFYTYLKQNELITPSESFPVLHKRAFATAILGGWYVIGVEDTYKRGALLASYNQIDKIIDAVFPMQKYTKTEIKAEIQIVSVCKKQQTQIEENGEKPWILQ